MGFKNILKNMFPYIATAASIGGPLGSMAASVVGAVLGVKVDNNEDAITAAIAEAQVKDPDALIKLQQAERDFQVQMEKLGLDSLAKLEQIAADDRASARAREIAVKDWTPSVLAAVLSLGFFGMLTVLIFYGVDEIVKDIILMMLGVLASKWGSMIDYFFGSSAGSAKKTQILEQQGKG